MYGKLFATAYTGSMFGAGLHVFAVWGYIIANKDADQFVELNPHLLAAIFGCLKEEVDKAIDYLAAPDTSSRSHEEDGRRITSAGQPMMFHVVNGKKYDEIRNADVRREQNRQAQLRHRSSDEVATRRGYVYYAGKSSSDRIKIGFSANPWARIKDLNTSDPDIELLATERGTMADERERHKQFEADRIGREWFAPSPELTALVDRLATTGSKDRSPATVATVAPTVATVAPSIDTATARDTDTASSGKSPEKGKTPPAAPRKRVAEGSSYTPEFEGAWKAYPKRANNSKVDAWRQWQRRIASGADPLKMIAGVKAYADYCVREGREPEKIKQAATFFGPGRHWESDYGVVEFTPSADEVLRKAPREMREKIARIESIAAEDDLEEQRTREFLEKRGRK